MPRPMLRGSKVDEDDEDERLETGTEIYWGAEMREPKQRGDNDQQRRPRPDRE